MRTLYLEAWRHERNYIRLLRENGRKAALAYWKESTQYINPFVRRCAAISGAHLEAEAKKFRRQESRNRGGDG